MKAQLNFDLDEPEDRMAHLRCVKASGMASVLFDLVYNTRKHCKTVDDVFDELNHLLDQQGINIDELIQ